MSNELNDQFNRYRDNVRLQATMFPIIGKQALDMIRKENEAGNSHAEHVNAHFAMINDTHAEMLALAFPADKKKIAALTMDEKLEWYAYQFQKKPGAYPVYLVGTEFERFWKWRVLIPIKFKRFFYRVKNGEIFKRYPHISELKQKGPSRI